MVLASLCRKGVVMTIIMRIYQAGPIDGVVSVKQQNRGPMAYLHTQETNRMGDGYPTKSLIVDSCHSRLFWSARRNGTLN